MAELVDLPIKDSVVFQFAKCKGSAEGFFQKVVLTTSRQWDWGSSTDKILADAVHLQVAL